MIKRIPERISNLQVNPLLGKIITAAVSPRIIAIISVLLSSWTAMPRININIIPRRRLKMERKNENDYHAWN